MKFRLLSDLHLEFQGMDVPPLKDDADTVLVLAGDIGLADKPSTFTKFIKRMSDQFRDVIWICGNHEYYGTSFIRGRDKIREQLDVLDVPNVHFGDRYTVVIDDTAFICATLWTDMDIGRNEASQWFIRQSLNDFRVIRTGDKTAPYARRFQPLDAAADFHVSKQFVFAEIARHSDKKTVVVTHHGPSYMSVHPMFAGDRLNPAYVTELGNDIVDAGGPNVWVHGHTHFSFDYMIGDTRVVVNPRGYAPHDINEDFDPKMVIEL